MHGVAWRGVAWRISTTTFRPSSESKQFAFVPLAVSFLLRANQISSRLSAARRRRLSSFFMRRSRTAISGVYRRICAKTTASAFQLPPAVPLATAKTRATRIDRNIGFLVRKGSPSASDKQCRGDAAPMLVENEPNAHRSVDFVDQFAYGQR